MWTARDRELHREDGRRYPSDLSDEEWSLTSGLFTNYRPLSATIREIVEACLYLVAEGCRWRALPKDFPPWQTVRWWWDRFRREGVWEAATHALTPVARAAAGRNAEPRTGLVDTQSVRCGPQKGERGWNGAKRLNGRKRHVLTCSAGFLLAVLVTAACLPARQARCRPAARPLPRVRLAAAAAAAAAAAGRRPRRRGRGRGRRRRPARRDLRGRPTPAAAHGLCPDPAPLACRAGLGRPDDAQQTPRPRLGAAAGGRRDPNGRREPPPPHSRRRAVMLKSNRVSAELPPEADHHYRPFSLLLPDLA